MSEKKDDLKPFPIQAEYEGELKGGNSTIPWWLAEVAYKEYSSLFGNGQTLERLAERGGFGRTEFLKLIKGEFR